MENKDHYSTGKIKSAGVENKIETAPLTNYNILVLNQSLKNNSSVSLVNTNVWRSGKAYDANVTAVLLDLYDKKNKWNIGGNVSMSNIAGKEDKNIVGYAHSIYLGKVSGQFNFNVWQDLVNAKYDKSDLGYFTNNNFMDQGAWAGYNWTKPTKWYNQFRVNGNVFYSRLVSAIDVQKRPEMMFQNIGYNVNVNGQLKNLWWVGANVNGGVNRNDFYEPRVYGRVFRDKARVFSNLWWESNYAKKLSFGGNLSLGKGAYFGRTLLGAGLFGKIRFSSKFSVDIQLNAENTQNQAGFAATQGDVIYFSKRDVISVENVLTAKYNFTNRMGLSLRTRHYWSKVNPKAFFELDQDGYLKEPVNPFTGNVNQNYNFVSFDMVYTWQFAQGSFINVVWKNIDENFYRNFEKNYFDNFGKTVSGNGYNNLTQFSSFSVKVIYFLDYLTERNRLRNKNSKKV